MELKKVILFFLIAFCGMWSLITVDKECELATGMGGKAGVDVGLTESGDLSVDFFGVKGEIGL